MRENQAAKTGSVDFRPRGKMAVTPVRTGPAPTFNLPSPEISVVCPTATPLTSVIALSGPGEPSSGMPRSRVRGFGSSALASDAMVRTAKGTRIDRKDQCFVTSAPLCERTVWPATPLIFARSETINEAMSGGQIRLDWPTLSATITVRACFLFNKTITVLQGKSLPFLAHCADVVVDHIGIVGHFFGGTWARFASCLYERFTSGSARR